MRFADVIEVDPEKMSGTPVFRGTRVPIQNYFDYLKGGDSLDTFLDHFPTVERTQVITLLEIMQDHVLGPYQPYEIAA